MENIRAELVTAKEKLWGKTDSLTEITITELIDKTKTLVEELNKSIMEHSSKIKLVSRPIPDKSIMEYGSNMIANSPLAEELIKINRQIVDSIQNINLLTNNLDL